MLVELVPTLPGLAISAKSLDIRGMTLNRREIRLIRGGHRSLRLSRRGRLSLELRIVGYELAGRTRLLHELRIARGRYLLELRILMLLGLRILMLLERRICRLSE